MTRNGLFVACLANTLTHTTMSEAVARFATRQDVLVQTLLTNSVALTLAGLGSLDLIRDALLAFAPPYGVALDLYTAGIAGSLIREWKKAGVKGDLLKKKKQRAALRELAQKIHVRANHRRVVIFSVLDTTGSVMSPSRSLEAAQLLVRMLRKLGTLASLAETGSSSFFGKTMTRWMFFLACLTVR